MFYCQEVTTERGVASVEDVGIKQTLNRSPLHSGSSQSSTVRYSAPYLLLICFDTQSGWMFSSLFFVVKCQRFESHQSEVLMWNPREIRNSLTHPTSSSFPSPHFSPHFSPPPPPSSSSSIFFLSSVNKEMRKLYFHPFSPKHTW